MSRPAWKAGFTTIHNGFIDLQASAQDNEFPSFLLTDRDMPMTTPTHPTAERRLRADPEMAASMWLELRGFYRDSQASFRAGRSADVEAIGDEWARLAVGASLPREHHVQSSQP